MAWAVDGRAAGKEDNEKGDREEKEASEVVPRMCHKGWAFLREVWLLEDQA